MLNRDPPGEGAGEVADEFFEPRRLSVRVEPEDIQKSFRLRPKAGAIEFARVLLGLLREDDPPGRVGRYQPGFSKHFEIGVRKPFRIDSRISGIDRR